MVQTKQLEQATYEVVSNLVEVWLERNSRMLRKVIRASSEQYAQAVEEFERCDTALVEALKGYDPINERAEVNGWKYVVESYGYIEDGSYCEGETVIQI